MIVTPRANAPTSTAKTSNATASRVAPSGQRPIPLAHQKTGAASAIAALSSLGMVNVRMSPIAAHNSKPASRSIRTSAAMFPVMVVAGRRDALPNRNWGVSVAPRPPG